MVNPLRKAVRTVFEKCQLSLHLHSNLLKSLGKVQNEEGFVDEFLKHLKVSMLCYKKEPAVERTMDFVVKFAVSKIPQKSTQGHDASDDEESPPMESFLLDLFNFLLDHHDASSRAVRFRVCQLVNRLLRKMGDNESIDEDIADRIFECMLTRVHDKVPTIRVHAVMAVARLQDPATEDCAVIAAYTNLIRSDRNADVRKAILQSIALTQSTLPCVIERTRDIKESVRVMAYLVIAKQAHIRALTIAQRLQILDSGLQDRSDAVRSSCINVLLKAWLTNVDNNILDFLACLDVENASGTVEIVLQSLFECNGIAELSNHISVLKGITESGSDLTVDFQSLTPDVAVFWRCLLKHIHTLGVAHEDIKEDAIPGVTSYCDYLSRYSTMQEEHAAAHIDFASSEFIVIELIKIGHYLDYTDEVGRKRMQELIGTWLIADVTTPALVPFLVERFDEVLASKDEMIQSLVEIISDIKEPMAVAQTPATAEQQRTTKLKLAKMKVTLNEMRDELEQAVEKENFDAAAAIKLKSRTLEAEKTALENSTSAAEQPNRIVKDDEDTILKCLNVASAMLECTTGTTLSPTLSTLVQTLILPGVQHENPFLRNVAIKCLGLCSLLSKEFACHHLVLFLQVAQMDKDVVRMTSLQVIFDLLQMFGIDAFPSSSVRTSGNEAEGNEGAADNASDVTVQDDASDLPGEEISERAVTGVLEILMMLLDSESWDVRTTVAEGMAKLLLSGRICSARLLSRLILLWYNPTSEDDVKLRHCLGVFFPVFAHISRANQELINEAFLPTFHTLCSAPASSPLSTVNINNVVDLVVQLTNSNFLNEKQRGNSETSLHDAMAMSIANEILSQSLVVEHIRILCRMLTFLNLSRGNQSTVADLKVLIEGITEMFDDRICRNHMERSRRNLALLAPVTQSDGAPVALPVQQPPGSDPADPGAFDECVAPQSDDSDNCDNGRPPVPPCDDTTGPTAAREGLERKRVMQRGGTPRTLQATGSKRLLRTSPYDQDSDTNVIRSLESSLADAVTDLTVDECG